MIEKPRTPKYEEIKQELLEEIRQGEFLPGHSFISESMICRRFGVSRITAVRALNDLVQQGVLTRRQGKGTFVTGDPDLHIQLPCETSPRLLACICNQLHGQHIISLIRGVQHACREAGYNLLLFDSTESPKTEALNLERATESGARGIIINPIQGSANLKPFKTLLSHGSPLVMTDHYYPALSTDVVVFDNVALGYKLTECMINMGHRYIAAVWVGPESTSVRDRLTGYRQALVERGLPIIRDLCPPISYEDLSQEGREELIASWFAAPYRPTAILAVNGYLLDQVVTALTKLRINIPKDVVLGSMDNGGPPRALALAAAVMDLPSYEMGIGAVNLLLDRVGQNEEKPTQQMVLPVHLASEVAAHTDLQMVST